MTGTPESMAKVPLSICDIAAGMYAASAVQGALIHRWRTGEGQEIQVSMFDCMMDWLGYFPYFHWHRGQIFLGVSTTSSSGPGGGRGDSRGTRAGRALHGHRDEAGLVKEAEKARDLGFVGKVCIHPSQVAPVNRAFTPTREEVEQARRIVTAAASQGTGAIVVDGRMIDRPLVKLAQRVMAMAQRAGLE